MNGVNKLYRSSTLFTPGTVTIDAATTTTTAPGVTTTTVAGATTTTVPGSTTTTTLGSACAGDVTPPTGEFSIGPSGSAEDGFTATQNVSLQLSFTDPCEPMVANFSNDGVTWGADVVYDPDNPQVSWSLTAGNEQKTVFGRVRDGLGNTTTLAPHTVILDATAPGAPGAGNVLYTVSCSGSTRTVVLSWAAAVDPDNHLRGYRVYRSTDATTWSELLPQPSGTTKSDSHSKNLNSVRYYVVAYDMAGNVMEWCSDWYASDYYARSPRKNPKGPEEGAYRVVRGGTFFVEAFDLRSAARSAAWPSFQGHRMIGFRAVREP